jgi:histidine triad (HIT) family protein
VSGPAQCCPLCPRGLAETGAVLIAEDERTVSLLHPQPASDGHALVVPRAHASDLYEIDPDDLAATIHAAQRLALALRDRLDAQGINLLNACRPAGWQTIFHFHLHVVPRYHDDALQPPWTPRPGDRAKIAAVAAALRE